MTYSSIDAKEMSTIRMQQDEPFVAITFSGPMGGHRGMMRLDLAESAKLGQALITAVNQQETGKTMNDNVAEDITGAGNPSSRALNVHLRAFVREENNNPDGWIEAICLAIENVQGIIEDCTPGFEIDSAIAEIAKRSPTTNMETFVQALVDQLLRQQKLMVLAAQAIPPLNYPEIP